MKKSKNLHHLSSVDSTTIKLVDERHKVFEHRFEKYFYEDKVMIISVQCSPADQIYEQWFRKDLMILKQTEKRKDIFPFVLLTPE